MKQRSRTVVQSRRIVVSSLVSAHAVPVCDHVGAAIAGLARGTSSEFTLGYGRVFVHG